MKPSNSPPGGQGSQQVRRVNFLLPGDNFPDFGVKPPLLAAPTSPKNRRTSPKMYRDLVLGSHFMISLPIKTWQFSIQSYVNHMIRGDISLLSPPSLNFYTKHVRDHSVAIGFIPWVQVAESQQPEDFSQSQQETLTMVMESR